MELRIIKCGLNEGIKLEVQLIQEKLSEVQLIWELFIEEHLSNIWKYFAEREQMSVN